jgi:4-hydroxythreonine-4-phosphate dehydrogenase
MSDRPLIAITCGDPAGIGPEVVASWLRTESVPIERLRVFGPHDWVRRLEDETGLTGVPLGPVDYRPQAGRPDRVGAKIAWEALRASADACRSGAMDAVVTAPISKAAMADVGFPHPGHTEFFAEAWGGNPVMAFTGSSLRVALVTWHIPLSAVPAEVTPERLERSVRAVEWLARAEGVQHPRIAVCGLNPHAGEDGLLGCEERDWINPLLRKLADSGIAVGPAQPADTVFGRMANGSFDAVVALYHDQGLAPLKTVAFDQSVNVTLGLPHVRTSPDHGTAFGIAGRGLARHDSLGRAVRLADCLARFRSPH